MRAAASSHLQINVSISMRRRWKSLPDRPALWGMALPCLMVRLPDAAQLIRAASCAPSPAGRRASHRWSSESLTDHPKLNGLGDNKKRKQPCSNELGFDKKKKKRRGREKGNQRKRRFRWDELRKTEKTCKCWDSSEGASAVWVRRIRLDTQYLQFKRFSVMCYMFLR